MKVGSLTLVLLILGGVSLGACQKKQPVPVSASSPAADNAAAPAVADNSAASAEDHGFASAPGQALSAADIARRQKRFVVINGEPATFGEFEDYLDLFVVKSQRNQRGIRQAALGIINNRLLAARAVKEGLDKSPEIRGKIGIATNKIWKGTYWAEVVRPRIKITDADLMKDAPKFLEKRKVFQIITDDEAKAEALRKRIVEGNEKFEAVAKAESSGLSAEHGGDTGYVDVENERYEKPIRDMLFNAKKGEISKVMPTRIGYSIFKVTDIQTVAMQRDDWFKGYREKGIAAKEKEIWDKNFQTLKKSHKVVLKEETGKKLVSAMEKNEDLSRFASLPLVEVDGIRWVVSDIIDPSGLGVIHNSNNLEEMIDTRLRQYLLDFEMEKLGLKAAHKDLVSKERIARENVLARELIKKISANVTVTDDDVKQHFTAHADKYRAPEMLDVSTIELYDPTDVDRVYAFMKAGKSFAEAADKFSVNRSLKGGRIGPVPEKQIAPQFASVKTLKPSQYTMKPIELVNEKTKKKSYGLFCLNAIVPARRLDFSEVNKADIKKSVFAEKQEAMLAKIFDDIKKNNKVEFEKGVDEKLSRYAKTMKKGGTHAAVH